MYKPICLYSHRVSPYLQMDIAFWGWLKGGRAEPVPCLSKSFAIKKKKKSNWTVHSKTNKIQ